jgi:membrane fusion protein (multidrug efflux system)
MSHPKSSDAAVAGAGSRAAGHAPPHAAENPGHPKKLKAHKPKKKRGAAFWLAVAVAAVAGGGWLVHFIHRSMTFEETDDAYINGHIHQISARAAGTVTEVLVHENEMVKSGQVLARLDPLALEISLQKAKAALAQGKAEALQARAALDQAKAQDAQAQARAASAEAQVQQIEAQLQIANVNFERSQRLFASDTHAVSKAEVDTARSTAQSATAALAGAKADLLAARARAQAGSAAVESAQAEIEAADARVAAQAAGVRDAEREFSYKTITAPSDGRIGNKNVEVGNRVQIGQALFALVGEEDWIVANFKETQIKRMHAGQPVEITVDAVGSHEFAGRLDSIAPATGAQFALLPADNATGNFTKVVQRVPVKIVFELGSARGFEERLRPGLSAVVSVKIKRSRPS